MMGLPRRAWWLWVVVVVGGCAGAASDARVTSPFTRAHAQVFDDSVDFVGDPAGLEGPWYDGWQSEMDQRVRAADLIAAVTVRTLRTDVDLDRRRTLRLVAEVDDVLLGEAPDDELMLMVREDQPGFGTVDGNDERILDRAFVAYVKWARRDDGRVGARWHLAPATDGVIAETTTLVRRHHGGRSDEPRRRVIVHEH